MVNKASSASLCECGCGEYAKIGNRFISGHQCRGREFSPETIAKMKASAKGRVPSESCVVASIKANKGTPLSDDHKLAISRGNKGIPKSPEHIAALKKSAIGRSKGENNPMYGVRGGGDLVNHHYIYDENDLSSNVVQMTRSDHTTLHNLLRNIGYIIPHINARTQNE